MSLNPEYSKEANRNYVRKIFKPNESPYINMYKAGTRGIPIEIIAEELYAMRVSIRRKDIENWERGMFDAKNYIGTSIRPGVRTYTHNGVPFENSKLTDFPTLPVDWTGTENRFFPCTADNIPMKKWGWSEDYNPCLLDQESARALSPVGWVGQNMLYQPFIVMDIDGVGHGVRDEYVIAFGNIWHDKTMCMEDPMKPGSFHLYFKTDRLIPVKHFPHAKLDLMGNAVNAAVYLKNKVSNGLPMLDLDETIWRGMMQYQQWRKVD